MKETIEIESYRINSEWHVSQKLVKRVKLAEDKLEEFETSKFVEKAVREKLEALEKEKGKLLDWRAEPVYLDEPSVKKE